MYGLGGEASEHSYVCLLEDKFSNWSGLDQDWSSIVYPYAIEHRSWIQLIRRELAIYFEAWVLRTLFYI